METSGRDGGRDWHGMEMRWVTYISQDLMAWTRILPWLRRCGYIIHMRYVVHRITLHYIASHYTYYYYYTI